MIKMDLVRPHRARPKIDDWSLEVWAFAQRLEATQLINLGLSAFNTQVLTSLNIYIF